MSLLALSRPDRPSWAARIAVAVAALAILLVPVLQATPAHAAEAIVVLTPSSATAESNVNTTYTLNITCNGPGACDNTVVSIPTNTVTGNGANTDMASWISASSCPEVTRTVVGGEVRFTYGNLPTGLKQCTFTVRAPEYTTLNGAQATLTPTISGSSFATSTGASAVLTVTAGHNASLATSGPSVAISGAQFTYTIAFGCGAANAYDGDIGFSQIHIESQLPANFQYSSYSMRSAVPGTVTITPPAVGSQGGTFVFDDPTGAQCANPPLNAGNYQAIRIVGTIIGPVGSTACNAATASFTYIDGVTGSLSATQSPCTTTVNLQTVPAKGAVTSTIGPSPIYTFPGNWDQSNNSLTYTLSSRTQPATNSAGVSYEFSDALPCLTNVSGTTYQSNALGTLCQSPAFIPTRITATGFTPTAADIITLTFADGSTQDIPFASGGWTLPAPSTGGGVAELHIPPFPGQASNVGTTVFSIAGYASPSAAPGFTLRNTSYTTPYYGGSAISTPQSSLSTPVVILDPKTGSGQTGQTVLYPSVFAQYTSNCQATGGFVSPTASQRNHIELSKAPSEAIYFDYLAPIGSSISGSAARAFSAVGLDNGLTFTSASITPTVTANYNGSGRTLYQWVIPAGVITVPGVYRLQTANWTLNLGAGCAGTFESDMTLGYGAPVRDCLFNNNSSVRHQLPPMIGSNNDLTTNATPIANNFCGYSSKFTVEAMNPAYSVNKTVQGNLDPSPATGGALGHVSPTGGQATYNVTFANSGTSSNLTDPIMYDILPRVGDTRASQLTPRNSAFTVTLLSVGTIPANVTLSYSTAANPCRPEVLATNPGCVDDWSTTPPTPISATTALRIAYSGVIGVAGSSFPTSFSVPYTVSTPTSTSGAIAYNSVGTNVIAGTNWFGAAESDLVGLQAAENQPQITKSASVTEYDAVGDTITYTFTVTNNTTVTLTNVGVTDVITDAAAGATAPAATCVTRTSPTQTCSGATTTLAAGQSATFTATYTVRQADLDHGSITDTATSTGTPPTGGALNGSSNSVTVTAAQAPSLELVKSASPTIVDSVGDTITYEFEVTNTGNVTVSGLAIEETAFSGSGSISAITCPSGPLAPTQSATCTATYPVTQADLTAGAIDNTAVATATAPGGPVSSDESSASVDVEQTASLSLVKSASPSEEAAYTAGQLITYSFVVTNTGNVPVDDIAIDEVAFSGTDAVSAIDCPATTLAPTAQVTCTATYTLTQEDVDALTLSNTAEATGTSVAGPVTSNESSTTTPQLPDASLELTKTASTSFVNGADEVVTYTFSVRNTGNVTIDGIAIDETEFSGSGALSAIDCPTTSLIPGGIVDCTATYTVTQDDIDAGSIENTAVATGLDPTGAEVTSPESDWLITANIDASLSLVKTGDLDAYAAVGDVIEYAFEVTNTGNVTLSGVGIEEGDFTGSGSLSAIDCPTGDVAPGDSVTCAAQYEVTQADLDRGSIDNTAVAFATPAGGDEPVESESSSESIPAAQDAALTLVKSASPTTLDAEGDVISYEFLVTNTGNVTISGIAITETAFSGSGGAPAVTCSAAPLAPGDDTTCTATYAVTQADVDAGVVENTAIATANGGDAESEESSASVTIERSASLSLVKSADPADPELLFAGDTITYSFVVTNTGNVTITNPVVTETEFTGTGTLPELECDDTVSLAPGDQFVCQVVYTLTQDDVDAGTLSNTATASGTAPDGAEPLTPPSDTVTVPSPEAAGLELEKATTTERLSSVGQVVTYTFTVTNTGNTTATGLTISEDEFTGRGTAPEVECPTTTVLPGQTVVCTAEYIVVAADLDGTALSNTATATAESAGGDAVVSDASSAIISDVVDARPPLALTGATVLWTAGAAALVLLASGGVLFALVQRRRREQGAA
ncbi:beta strand repeat-containing protein [Salinibacterium soli]|uniref:DUF7507 domain-containing protein n=1 Tax=Antiquaquibacter soli TaxID=3064523 RepID=A0ABT9BR48_9MICO|nr:hypothetical protein [Protaetiibacter sp. WY-16]MDO7883519.1 hypothetical protein [Protaetiibacter sp. WY-16]